MPGAFSSGSGLVSSFYIAWEPSSQYQAWTWWLTMLLTWPHNARGFFFWFGSCFQFLYCLGTLFTVSGMDLVAHNAHFTGLGREHGLLALSILLWNCSRSRGKSSHSCQSPIFLGLRLKGLYGVLWVVCVKFLRGITRKNLESGPFSRTASAHILAPGAMVCAS